MKLSAPKKLTFLISLIVTIVGLLFEYLPGLESLSEFAVPLVLLGFVLLALGTILKGW